MRSLHLQPASRSCSTVPGAKLPLWCYAQKQKPPIRIVFCPRSSMLHVEHVYEAKYLDGRFAVQAKQRLRAKPERKPEKDKDEDKEEEEE